MVAEQEVKPDAVRATLRRILESRYFKAAERRRKLLEYLVEQTLLNRGSNLKEFNIGVEVYARNPSTYDPRLDPIVRIDVGRLRTKLKEYYETDGREESIRIDLPKGSYVVTLSNRENTAIAAPTASVSQPAATVATKRVRPYMWAIVLVCLAVTGYGVYRWKTQPNGLHSVVVLPFQNLTGDSNKEYIADGITEELTDSLAHVSDLRVVARTSAFQFKQKAVDIRQIGKQLDADVVVEGSLRSSAAGYQLTVQVDRSRDGYHIRSQTLEGSTQDLSQLESDMTPLVLTALHRPAERGPVRRPVDPEAYNLFLQARALRGNPSKEAFDQAVTLLNKAIQQDPTYADAFAALASEYAAAAGNFANEPRAYAEKANAAADVALRFDPKSAQAYGAKGMVDSLVLLNWRRGEDELRTALRLMPQNSSVHNRLGLVLVARGQFQEGIAEERIAAKLDPLAPAGATLGLAYYMARQYDRALHEFIQVRDLHPGISVMHTFIGSAWEGKGDYEKAMQEYRLALPKVPGAKTYIAHLFAVTGKKEEALKMAAQLERPESGEPPNGFDLACIYAALGDRDKAFYWLAQASKDSELWFIKVHPMLDPLRSDPRFAQFLKKAGLSS